MTSQRPFTNTHLQTFRLHYITGDKPENYRLVAIGPLMAMADALKWLDILGRTCPDDSFTIRQIADPEPPTYEEMLAQLKCDEARIEADGEAYYADLRTTDEVQS